MSVVVLAFLVSFLTVSWAQCPQAEFVEPCTCRPWETGIFIVCHQVNNAERLNIVFQLLRDYEITRLLLKDCHINDTTSSGIFHGLNIKLIRLIDSSFTRPNSSANSGPITDLAPHIERLDITNCDGLFKVGQFSLSTLHKLQDLNVVRDTLGSVRNGWLPVNITNLRLEQCDISTVEAGALAHMASLKSLTLIKNQLTTLDRNALPAHCTQLVSIDLSENQIQTLPADFFSGMPELHTVNLYANRLQSLDQSIWRQIWSKLDRLWISGNDIICDDEVKWILNETRNPTVLFGACYNPENLRGTALASLSPENFPSTV